MCVCLCACVRSCSHHCVPLGVPVCPRSWLTLLFTALIQLRATCQSTTFIEAQEKEATEEDEEDEPQVCVCVCVCAYARACVCPETHTLYLSQDHSKTVSAVGLLAVIAAIIAVATSHWFTVYLPGTGGVTEQFEIGLRHVCGSTSPCEPRKWWARLHALVCQRHLKLSIVGRYAIPYRKCKRRNGCLRRNIIFV